MSAEARRQTVLVIDDDREVRESLRTLLQLDGYKVRTARDGQHAASLGAVASLRKPADIDTVLQLIEAHCVRQHESAPSCRPAAPVRSAASEEVSPLLPPTGLGT